MKYITTVTDANGENWSNLVGVFARVFPMVQNGTVTYYGVRYTIKTVAA